MKPYDHKAAFGWRLGLSKDFFLPIGMAVALGALVMVHPLPAAEPQSDASQSQSPEIDKKLVERWDARYRDDGRPAWDTGRPSSNLKRVLEQKNLQPCRALELGCGTGVNAVYLAKQGFEVTAIDIAPTALKLAKDRATKAGVEVEWIQGDVLVPPPLEDFDLIFDRGCYHGVRRQGPSRYVEVVKKLCRPGGRVLILAGNANESGERYGPPRVDEHELIKDFAAAFDLEELRETRFDTADRDVAGALAWSVLLRRKGDDGREP
jgi:SAM-dependent methyltransferase